MILPLLLLALQQPNVLVIVADDIGWTERSLLPSLDTLAADGVTFERAYAQPTCTITRIELQLGRFHRREGVGDLSMNAHQVGDDRLAFDRLSVAEIFNPHGYSSTLFGKWHLGRAELFGEMDQVTSGPHAQGWQWRAGNPTLPNAGPGASGYYDWLRVEAGDMSPEIAYATNVQRDAFLSWWAATSGPKLAYLCWSAAHAPWDAPPGKTLQPTSRENYEQVVTHLNSAIAAVLAAVSLEDTFVIFTSDNGTPDFGMPPGIWKTTTFEGGVRVPTIVAGPGVSAGVTTQRLVSLVDLPATVAELAGIEVVAGFDDSVSFADELGDWPGAPARQFVFCERYEVVSIPTAGYDDQAVIEATWKLRRVDLDGPGPMPHDDSFYMYPDVPLVPSQAIQNRLFAELASLPPRAQ